MPFEEAAAERRAFPMHAITQRPMAMYHSLGLAERLAAADPRREPPVHQPQARASLGLADDDWVYLTSHHGRIKVQRQADGRRQRRHGLDMERDRQARGAWNLDTRRAAKRARAS